MSATTMQILPAVMGQQGTLPQRQSGESDAEYIKRLQGQVLALQDEKLAEQFQLTRKLPPENPPRWAFQDPKTDVRSLKRITEPADLKLLHAKIQEDGGHEINFGREPQFFKYDDGTILSLPKVQASSPFFQIYDLYGDIDGDGKLDETTVHHDRKNKNSSCFVYSGKTLKYTVPDSETDPKKRESNTRFGWANEVNIDIKRKNDIHLMFADREREGNDFNGPDTMLNMYVGTQDYLNTRLPSAKPSGHYPVLTGTGTKDFKGISTDEAAQYIRKNLSDVPGNDRNPSRVFGR